MLDSETCTTLNNLRYQDGSEGSPSNPAKFKNQDYEQLKGYYVGKDQPFVDKTFPPNRSSLGYFEDLRSWEENDVKWLRPAEILKLQTNNAEPRFLKEGASRFDFKQGFLGDCWFLAAISALTSQKCMMAQVVPMDQSYENNPGIFHFRFWRFGKWVDVVIDDFLPTLNNHLMFVGCENEFWGPLMEKAYAKVCGSYAELKGGLSVEAFKDFTGGIAMIYPMANYANKQELWQTLNRATLCKSLICCATFPEGKDLLETGLVYGHAYSVTGFTEVEYSGKKVKLVRLMNPWGWKEWNGKWSDESDLWKKVSQADKKKCIKCDDGEFWMELEDFCQNFVRLYVCCETPNFTDGDLTCKWKCMSYDGKWVAGKSAGGSMCHSTFATNPQYRIQVTVKEDPKDENLFLSLMQKPQQEFRRKRLFYPTGLSVFKIPPGTPRGRLYSSFFSNNSPVNRTQYSYDRDVMEELSLEPGEYVIVPSTYKPNMTADFVLTVYTKSDITISDGEEVVMDTADEKSIRDLFSRYANQGGDLTAVQLQMLLNDSFHHVTRHGFGLETCMSMMAIVDLDRRMRMTFAEFSVLWKKICDYKKLFQQSDLNVNGSLSKNELSKAIQTAGINTNDKTVMLLMFRYLSTSSISLEDFIILMLRLDRMLSIYKNKSSGGKIHLTWEEWSDIFMYN